MLTGVNEKACALGTAALVRLILKKILKPIHHVRLALPGRPVEFLDPHPQMNVVRLSRSRTIQLTRCACCRIGVW